MPKAAEVSRGKSKTKPDQYFSRALEKGLQAVEELSQSHSGLTLMEAASKLKLTKPSAFRILRTLEALGYVSKTDVGRHYVIAGEIRRQVPARTVHALVRYGSEPLRTLGMEFRETVSMACLFDNHAEVIMVLESPQIMRMGNTAGRILPPHASSMGKAIAAFLDGDARERLLRSYGSHVFTEHTIVDELALRREFDAIRAAGHAVDREESTAGGICFGAPLLNGAAVVGAVSMSLPKIRLEGPEHEARVIEAVKRTAAAISRSAFGS